MLSIDQCKKLFSSGCYTDEEVEKIRNELDVLASLLVKSYIERGTLPANGLTEDKQNDNVR